MKFFRSYILVLASVAALSSCDDRVPILYDAPSKLGDQKLIIEEFTGVQCVNCPQGSDEIASFVAAYPGKVIPVSLHAGYFATPVPGKSTQDFRTADADFLYDYIGPAPFYPSAVFNRKVFTNSDLVYNQPSWAGIVQKVLESNSKYGLSLQTSFNETNRELTVTISGIAKEDINDNILAHVMITESNIVEWQKYPNAQGFIPDYVHKHVLRGIVSNFTGDKVATNPTAKQEFSKTYKYTVPDNWVAENCEVVGFISYSAKKEIIQAESKDLVD